MRPCGNNTARRGNNGSSFIPQTPSVDARYRFKRMHALQRFLARVTAKFEFGLKIRTDLWSFGHAKNTAAIVVAELHATHTRRFAIWHTGNGRADTERNTAGTTTGTTGYEMRPVH